MAEPISAKSPDLKSLQLWMSWAIAGAPNPARKDAVPAVDCAEAIVQGQVSRDRRVRAYSDAYSVRLTEVLSIDFKSVLAVLETLDSAGFEKLAADYLADHPSRSPSIAELGRAMPDFLRQHPLATELPFLADLATLEWRMTEAYHAYDVPPLDLTPLATLPPEAWANARFELDPSVFCLETERPVLRLYRLAQADRPIADAIPHRLRRRERLLIFRDPTGEASVRRLTVAEHRAVGQLGAGATLGEVSATCERSQGAVAAVKIQGWFQNWVSQGILRKVVLS